MIIQNSTNQVAPVAQPTATASLAPRVSTESQTPNTPVSNSGAVEVAPQISPEMLKNAVAIINQVMQQSNSSLQFSVDGSTHQPVVRLVDTNTGELIRQIPSEETLAISRSIDEVMHRQGLLFKRTA